MTEAAVLSRKDQALQAGFTAADRRRFWEKVDMQGSPMACWLWQKSDNGMGYGQFGLHGTTVLAHRAAWAMAGRPLPPGMFLCHHCDTPACVNISHMSLGTQKQNMGIGPGRALVGENNPSASPGARAKISAAKQGERHHGAKLTEADVLAIRSDPRTHEVIAGSYPVNRETISRIKRGEAWKHVRKVT